MVPPPLGFLLAKCSISRYKFHILQYSCPIVFFFKFIQLDFFPARLPQKGFGCWQKLTPPALFNFCSIKSVINCFGPYIHILHIYASFVICHHLKFYTNRYSLNSLFIVFNISLDKNFFNHRWRVIGSLSPEYPILKKLGLRHKKIQFVQLEKSLRLLSFHQLARFLLQFLKR